MKRFILSLLGALSISNAALAYEQAPYTVLEKQDAIEIRQYEPIIVAMVTLEGERKKTINQSFRILFDYISGNNTAQKEIKMTVPVTQTNEQGGQEIKMTVPVTQQEDDNGTYSTTFMMPSEWTMKTLPKPNNDDIRLVEVPEKKMIAIQFSGFAGPQSLAEETEKLLAFAKKKKLKTLGAAVHAYYNDPFTLPWWRRNEVLFEIK